ncbi:hypothetical protein HJ590_04240 [Naumannella sp. ID2617S]|nr:hypothetical protein [Naumannella sp. ID2617S]
MTTARAHHAPAGVRGLLLTTAAAILIIAGLLGMHTLTTSHDATMITGVSSAPTHAIDTTAGDDGSASVTDAMMSAADAPATAEAHCAGGDCGTSMPDHTMLTMCVLALLSAAIVLLAPAALRWFRTTAPFLMLRPALLLRTLPPSRPPSLRVLSISRT